MPLTLQTRYLLQETPPPASDKHQGSWRRARIQQEGTLSANSRIQGTVEYEPSPSTEESPQPLDTVLGPVEYHAFQ